MQHAKNLLLSRPFLSRIPDQSLILSEAGEGAHHVQATRDTDGSYALVYVPSGKAVDVDTAKLSGDTLNAFWFDPRTGTASQMDKFANLRQAHTFTPPPGGPDWVVVLDDAARNFPRPGSSPGAAFAL